MTFYGLGTILGAGIYVLIAAVAGAAGSAMPFSFVLAAIIAGFTAFSYAELVARYPLSAGEAVYVDRAFGARALTLLVGYAVVVVGIVSAATIARGFTGYLDVFVQLPEAWVMAGLIAALGLVAAVGILESVVFAAAITLIEIAGLLLVLAVAGESLTRLAEPSRVFGDSWHAAGLMGGAFLAFYAFIGFEDMVNVAEEVKAPERNLPRAIVLALAISTLLYVMIALTAVTALPPEQLAKSTAPLADIVRVRGVDPSLMAVISLVAVVNGALVQIIMAARVLYGMARQGAGPALLARVSPRTRTPVVATALVTAIVLLFAEAMPLVRLASLTSAVTLLIFMAVNAALWRLKVNASAPSPTFTCPLAVPVTGSVLCGVLLASSFASS